MSDLPITKPIYRTEDHELVGAIISKDSLWIPCTVFGYPLASAMPEDDAARFLESRGLELLLDGWQFKDDDGEWYNCVIVEAKPELVTVKISDYGHPDAHQIVTIKKPDEHSIRRL